MDHTNWLVLVHVALLTVIPTIRAGASKPQGLAGADIEGIWQAVGETPDSPAPPVVFRIVRNVAGVPKAFLESPDQIHRNLIDEVAFEDGRLRLVLCPIINV